MMISTAGGQIRQMKEYFWFDDMMGVEYLRETEDYTIKQTNEAYPEAPIHIKNLLNILFRFQYFLHDIGQAQPHRFQFEQQAYCTYIRIPYSFQALYNLWTRGYYLEASLVLRHIIEGFVQLRYFNNHLDQIEKHLHSDRARDRVSFRTMFEEIAPGSYKDFYGTLLSGLAHGGIAADMYKMKYTSTSLDSIVQGCEFNEALSRFIIKNALDFGYGYLNYAHEFFSTLSKTIDPDVANNLNSYIQQSKSCLKANVPFINK
jgi:hypothetical protein